jgi:histidinol-phosphate aminotransferase
VSWVADLARPEIVALQAYEPASSDPSLTRLHANELPWKGAADTSALGLNRYPEPQSQALLQILAALYDAPVDTVLAGRGSDEMIDLLVRAFCHARRDAVVVCPPTFGMYAVAAHIQGARVIAAPLRREQGYTLDQGAVRDGCRADTKIVFVCSPNNPTGNLLSEACLLELADALHDHALLVVDEAYLEFTGRASMARHRARYPNIAVLRTLSKAHGLAGARCGTLIAHPEVIGLVKKVLPPYAVSQLSIEAVLAALEPGQLARRVEMIAAIRAERTQLAGALGALSGVTHVWPSEANFLLVEFADAAQALERARRAQLLVRDARHYPGLQHALRVTVGTAAENARLLSAWS